MDDYTTPTGSSTNVSSLRPANRRTPSRSRTLHFSPEALELDHAPAFPLAESPTSTSFDIPAPTPQKEGHHSRRASQVASMRSFVEITRSSADGEHEARPPSAREPSVKEAYTGSGAPDDPYIVSFGALDSGDPRQWAYWTKMAIMVGGALEMTGGTLAISLFSSGTASISREFATSRELVITGTTLYLVALAFSSLVTAPLGEMYGRRPVMIISFFLFTITNLGIGFSHNIATYLVLRFFSGLFGSASMSHAPAMANDLFNESEVGIPLTIAGVGRFGGPVLGPLIGGFINQHAGWRWLAHTLTCFSFFCFLLALFCVPETYAPAILRGRARKMADDIGAHHITAYEQGHEIGGWAEEAFKYLVTPFLFLTCEPIVLLLSLHVSFLYGILNLYFSAYPFIFVTLRGWSQGNAGLPFIACLIGFAFSFPIASYMSKIYGRAAARSPTGRAAPEQRLWFGIIGAGLLPISLFWLAWSANRNVHWIAPVLSGVFFAIGQLGLTMSVFTYFSDVYQYRMGSVLAGSNFMRFLVGGAFPLFSAQMFAKLGAGWALTLLGFLCVVFFPAPIIFYVYGARIRKWSKMVPKQPVGSAPREKDQVHMDEPEERLGEEEDDRAARSRRASVV